MNISINFPLPLQLSMLIDSHAHLTSEDFSEDIEMVLIRAKEAGVKSIINICTHPLEVEKSLKLAKHFSEVYTVAATTPHSVEKEGEAHFPAMENYAKQGDLIAIGETGLDYHHYVESKETQKKFLRRYIQLALQCHLPIVIHCRDAFSDFFNILDEESYVNPGVLHCFTGNREEALQLIQRGWYISFSGIVTFKKSVELQQIVKEIPLENLLIETDAPYLAPIPHRSKRNEPAFLLDTAKFIAQLRDISLCELAQATQENARNLFRLF